MSVEKESQINSIIYVHQHVIFLLPGETSYFLLLLQNIAATNVVVHRAIDVIKTAAATPDMISVPEKLYKIEFIAELNLFINILRFFGSELEVVCDAEIKVIVIDTELTLKVDESELVAASTN